MKIRQEFRDISSISLILGAAIVAIRGYVAGTGDHLVLSALGVAKANPGTLENDYFLWNSPQPHWAFDLFTEWSARLGHLSAGYFLYWAAGVIALSAGLYFTAQAFELNNLWLSTIAVGLLITLGPLSILGTTTVAVPIAIPHMLGAALVVLVTGLVAKQNMQWAGAFTVLTAITHVQHGVIALGVFTVGLVVFTALGNRHALRSAWWAIPAAYTVYYDITVRPIITNNGDFQYVCEVLVPYHCQVDSWKTERFILGAVTILLALLASWIGPRNRQVKFALTVVTGGLAVVSLISVVAALLEMAGLNETLQSLNVYRINAFFIPMAAFGILLLANGNRATKGRLLALVATSWVFIGTKYDQGALAKYPIAAIVTVMALVLFQISARQRKQMMLLVLALISVAGYVNSNRTSPTYFHFAEKTQLIAARLADETAVDATILSDPTITWVRTIALRATVVDCKYKPYGGEALVEFKRRMQPLGGYREACQNHAYKALSAKQLTMLAKSFGAQYILLEADDERTNDFVELGWRVTSIGNDGKFDLNLLTPG